jgi:pimeloyl-ACP methyl ester carboxylesterase
MHNDFPGPPTTSTSGAAPHTVLLHGLARTRLDLILFARRLRRMMPDTTVHLFEYPSRVMSLAEIVEQLDTFVGAISPQRQPVSFVGHSLGGIVARALDLRGESRVPLRRLVTLGSPHGGATIARVLARIGVCRSLLGPILSELAELQLPQQPQQLEIGCVVGALGNRFGFWPLFGEDNDGVVLAREAQQVAYTGVTTQPLLHAFMPFSTRAVRLSAQFLAQGRFDW